MIDKVKFSAIVGQGLYHFIGIDFYGNKKLYIDSDTFIEDSPLERNQKLLKLLLSLDLNEDYKLTKLDINIINSFFGSLERFRFFTYSPYKRNRKPYRGSRAFPNEKERGAYKHRKRRHCKREGFIRGFEKQNHQSGIF